MNKMVSFELPKVQFGRRFFAELINIDNWPIVFLSLPLLYMLLAESELNCIYKVCLISIPFLLVLFRSIFISQYFLYRIEINEDGKICFHYMRFNTDLMVETDKGNTRIIYALGSKNAFLPFVSVCEKCKGYYAKERIYQYLTKYWKEKYNSFTAFIDDNDIATTR